MSKFLKPRNASFSLEERLELLKLIRPHVKMLDSHLNDANAHDAKRETWDSIRNRFVDLFPDRHGATSKDVRDLWRRMKHRARMQVRQTVAKAKQGSIRTLNEEEMGWMPDKNHTVVDINDLGLEADTKAITEFVPLLEEEATVLETRNGIVDGGAARIMQVDDGGSGSQDNDYETYDVSELDDDIAVVQDEDNEKNEESLVYQERRPGVNTSRQFAPREPPEPGLYRVLTSSNTQQGVSASSPIPSSSRNDITTPVIANVFQPSPSPLAHTLPSQPLPPLPMNGPSDQELNEIKIRLLHEEHKAKMNLIKMKHDAAKAKMETARAKRSAYDEKRMFYFEKRKRLHSEPEVKCE